MVSSLNLRPKIVSRSLTGHFLGFSELTEPQDLQVSTLAAWACSVILTVKQVSARLNCPPGLVYKLVQQGALKAHRINRAVRVSEEQLQEYLTAAAQPIEQPRRAFATKFL